MSASRDTPPDEGAPDAMLDVHPPHHAVNSWRDFLIHIATITIGLLIALGLEAGVEAMHHRHLVHETREGLRREIEANKKLIAKDRQEIELDRQNLQQAITILHGIEADRSKPYSEINFHLYWASPSSAAWLTARDTGALALMRTEAVQGYALVYTQQEIVHQQALEFVAHQTHIDMPLTAQQNKDPRKLAPAQLDELIHGCASTVADIDYLESLMRGLDTLYGNALRDL